MCSCAGLDTYIPLKRTEHNHQIDSVDNRFDSVFSSDRKIRNCCQSGALPTQSKWKVQVFSLLTRLGTALLSGSRTFLSWFHVQLTCANYMPNYGSNLFVDPLP